MSRWYHHLDWWYHCLTASKTRFFEFSNSQAVPPPILVVPPLDPTFGSLNGPPNEPKSISIKAQLAPNWVNMITPKANLISPLNCLDLRHMISKHESYARHVIGSSGTRLILRHIILFCSLLPNWYVDLHNFDLHSAMSAPSARCPNSWHESSADT